MAFSGNAWTEGTTTFSVPIAGSASAPLDSYIDTPGDGTIREDLADLVSMVSPMDTPVYSMSGNTTASQIRHEWNTDELRTSLTGAPVAEGTAFTTAHQGTPRRLYNYCAIFRESYSITSTQKATERVGGSALARQQMKAMLNLRNEIEYALINNNFATTLEGEADKDPARNLRGLTHWAPTGTGSWANWPDHSVAITGTYDIPGGTDTYYVPNDDDINGICQKLWEAGTMCEVALVGGATKRYLTRALTDPTTARNEFNIQASDKTVVHSVMQYQGDFGVVNFMLERYVATADNAGETDAPATYEEMYFIKPSYLTKAWLRPISSTPQPNSGDTENHMIDCELTLRVENPKTVAKLTGSGLRVTP